MDLFDNKTKLLGDDLKKSIKPNSKIKIVASYFSIYAFEALKDELSKIGELQFIFPTPTFVSKGITDKLKKEKREYYIPKHMNENMLYGTDFEIRLRNQLTQKVIAKECADWVKNKVTFKSNITPNGIPNFIYVDNGENESVYMPINGFTSTDLGYEKDNMMFNLINKLDGDYTRQFF